MILSDRPHFRSLLRGKLRPVCHSLGTRPVYRGERRPGPISPRRGAAVGAGSRGQARGGVSCHRWHVTAATWRKRRGHPSACLQSYSARLLERVNTGKQRREATPRNPAPRALCLTDSFGKEKTKADKALLLLQKEAVSCWALLLNIFGVYCTQEQ